MSLCRFRPGAARRSPARGRPLTTIIAAPEPPVIDHKKGKKSALNDFNDLACG